MACFFHRFRPFLFAALSAVFAGCAALSRFDDGAYLGPFFVPHDYAGDPVMPASIRRVVLLPVCGGGVAASESAAALDHVLLASLQQQARFEVVSLSRAECRTRFGVSEFSSAAALPPDFLDRLARVCAADAVLFVDLTVYQPYRPLRLGLRAKLATVREVRLVWTFDEVFSGTNPAIINSIRRQTLAVSPAEPPVDVAFATLQSPGRFAAFAADAMFQTLPAR